MRGTSQASLTATREQVERHIADAGADAVLIGEQLYSFVDALDASGALRRALADPSRLPADKATLVRDLLGDQADERTVAILVATVSQRWSAEKDLVEAIDILATDAMLAAAESRGTLETVEGEIFAITRSMSGQREVRRILSDVTVSTQRRIGLLDSILAGRVDPVTQRLAQRAAVSPRGDVFVTRLARIGDRAAERRQRTIATVTVSAPLSAAHMERLERVLTTSYGKPMHLNITVDPDVVGGIRIQVGADVIDSTVLARLTQVQRRLAG